MNIYKLKNGKEIYCDRPDKLHAQQALDDFTDAFHPFLNGKSMWTMDIGTSCGDSTVIMASLLSPDSRILAFEPSREIYPLLVQNLAQNTGVRYDIHTVAAGNSFEMIDFVYGSDNGGLLIPSLIPERGPCKVSYQVQVVQTYTYLRTNYTMSELDNIQFIKIDTEGYDYVVLEGLAPLIFRNLIPIMVEWWNDPSNNNRLFNVIEKLFYKAYNSKGELVTRYDFCTDKRTQDLILRPV